MPADTSPSPPFRGEREGPDPQGWEGEVGGTRNRNVGLPHPALSPRPAGGEGKGRVVRARLRRQIFEKPVLTLSLDSPAASGGEGVATKPLASLAPRLRGEGGAGRDSGGKVRGNTAERPLRSISLLAVFAVLCSETTASRVAFAAEILGRPRFGRPKNSQSARCSFAVFRLCRKKTHPRETHTHVRTYLRIKLNYRVHDAISTGQLSI
jgi:hypothetical protein